MSKNFSDEQIKAIHSRFADLRKSTETADQKAISQRELARRTGLTFPRISNLENASDDTEPSIADLLAYRNYFNVSVDYLLCLEDEPTTDINIKAISKEYGLSSKSLSRLKDLVRESEGPILGDPIKTLNVALESGHISYFLWKLEVYLDFYPVQEKEYVVIEPSSDDEGRKYIKADRNFLDDLEHYKDIPRLSAEQFERLTLDGVKEGAAAIKKHSFEYLKNAETDLKKTKEELEEYLIHSEEYNETYFELPRNYTNVKRALEDKIIELERELEDGKRRR